jgi:uncharacterized ubiquitin-like protein YukD
MAADS